MESSDFHMFRLSLKLLLVFAIDPKLLVDLYTICWCCIVVIFGCYCWFLTHLCRISNVLKDSKKHPVVSNNCWQIINIQTHESRDRLFIIFLSCAHHYRQMCERWEMLMLKIKCTSGNNDNIITSQHHSTIIITKKVYICDIFILYVWHFGVRRHSSHFTSIASI